MEIVPGHGARFCVCRVAAIRARRLGIIPPKFAGLQLSQIKPDLRTHPLQAEVIPYVQTHPDESYLLAGNFGTGKSMLMWLLYRHAVKNSTRKPVICTLNELLNEYRAFIRSSESRETPALPRLNAQELKQSDRKYAIFLDDIDKARPTEYAAEQLFEVLNAIYEYGHQLVTTTNLDTRELAEHFDRADERYGGAIVRRLVDGVNVYQLF